MSCNFDAFHQYLRLLRTVSLYVFFDVQAAQAEAAEVESESDARTAFYFTEIPALPESGFVLMPFIAFPRIKCCA